MQKTANQMWNAKSATSEVDPMSACDTVHWRQSPQTHCPPTLRVVSLFMVSKSTAHTPLWLCRNVFFIAFCTSLSRRMCRDLNVLALMDLQEGMAADAGVLVLVACSPCMAKKFVLQDFKHRTSWGGAS